MLNIQEIYEQYFTIVYRYLLSLQSPEKSRRFQRRL